MSKKVLDVGNCGFDHSSLKRLIESKFQASLLQAHGATDAMRMLQKEAFDLVIVNRLMDRDGSPGLEIVQKIKADEKLQAVPVMMLSNHESAQQAAEKAGAEPGFGKSDLNSKSTLKLLSPYLEG